MEDKEESLRDIFFLEVAILFFIFIVSGIILRIPILLLLLLYSSFLFFSYLAGLFESSFPPFYGLNLKTQLVFILTILTYLLIRKPIVGTTPSPIFWFILWLYLNLFEPLLNIILWKNRKIPVLFVSAERDNPLPLLHQEANRARVLKWCHLKCQKVITREALETYLKQNADQLGRIKGVQAVVIDGPNGHDPRIKLLPEKYLTDFFLLNTCNLLSYFTGRQLKRVEVSPLHRFDMRIKRIIDFLLSLLFLLFFTPFFLLIALCVKLSSSGPVFYRHQRIGRNGKKFYLLKFRTMFADADKRLAIIFANNPKLKEEFSKVYKLKNDPRITSFGKFLRPYSFDELPQLFNVLKGDMSLVGPRPIVEGEIEYYKNASVLPFKFFPGMTGLWQTSGRTDTTYERRVNLDEEYCHNWNLKKDLKLIFKTIPVVTSKRGAY